MLTQVRIERYKSLYDVTVDLEPLTVFIGPNGSGKSNICEALLVLSYITSTDRRSISYAISDLPILQNGQDFHSKFWQGIPQQIKFALLFSEKDEEQLAYTVELKPTGVLSRMSSNISESLGKVIAYKFDPSAISRSGQNAFSFSGQGIANGLAAILFDNRDRFVEMEQRFIQLVPNISRIALKQETGMNVLRLVDRYSDHYIPAGDVSDGTLRILAFLTALYDVSKPNIICFEEPENGVHPWLLHKMMELLNLVSTEGVGGKPVQILVTTHSPVLLNYVKPEQIRVVELDNEGKTQIHKLPTDSVRFQKAMEAYDREIGELWFTNLFGGNPA